MAQRVNIQYSIDIEELPTEVERLLQTTYAGLDSLPDLRQSTHPALSLETLSQIDTLRIRMADIDYMLNDIYTIISGYMAYKAQSNLESSSTNTLETSEAQQQLLEEQIEKFKTQINQLGGDNEVAP